MSEAARTWLVIAAGFGSAFIAWYVTWSYMTTKHRALLKEIARQRETEQYEIRNARIINSLYGGMRATSIANMGDDDE